MSCWKWSIFHFLFSQLSVPTAGRSLCRLHLLPRFHGRRGEFSSAVHQTVLLHYVWDTSIMTDFHSQIGVRPNLLRLMLRDPVLWVKVAFGPCTPYQYRLTGPGQWAGARRAILSQWDRVAQPFRTRAVPEPESRSSVLFSPLLLVLGGTVITAVLMSKNETVPAQILDRCKIFLKDSWFTGYPQ